MNVLIVEDTEIKRVALHEFIMVNYPSSSIIEAVSFQDGVEKLQLGPFDFILLDMTMPTFNITIEDNGGKKRPFAGRDLISKMHRRGLNYPVIVVTRFDVFPDEHRNITLDELNRELKEAYPNLYKGFVFYDPAKTTWSNDLKKIISDLFKRKK